MSEYRRLYREQGWYFFTIVTYNRQKILTHPDNVTRLRRSFQYAMNKHTFFIDAIVVLPDHIHCIWRLPHDDDDFSTRWRLVKWHFSLGMDTLLTERGEKKVWQRRFWEHLLRNEKDWRYGSFHDAVKRGFYTIDWGSQEPDSIKEMDLE
ncbi:MAG: transposase [Candidatus Kuenenia stuttgartiensis]|uniref:Transposase IS200-like domain-containing protein n=1 Tax=Kuenenia stuttgartiensis TaxID=174633 RepID=Q1PWW2_KUEST|nr:MULTISPECIES: transposase [Kuenenia]MBW7940976.1 transposase [Candidatus Kuenenia stuttgartiensis]MBZ0192148.1 transposase [Candidatus Kuenenia stuttgartiensis]MCF6153001.1 transposase [Candidatus Kuenenia stuttgartiensis]MCL4727657.1 transposase [Candidatus Kuenenia stuttgartiensis]MCZ7622809.1 transposase [Candidatus Kuenenia sp.]